MFASIGVPLLTAVISYLLGCSNGAVIISKYILRDDVRSHGSGNAGLTNFYRTFGGPLTAVVILIDVLKAVAAVALVARLSRVLGGAWVSIGDLYAKYWATLFCLLGHMFPCMFHFRGGKGILSGAAAMFMIDWRLGAVALGVFLLCLLLTRYVSLGSAIGASIFIAGTFLLYPRDILLILLGIFSGGLVIWQHRGNIQRLIHGEERKFHLHREKQ